MAFWGGYLAAYVRLLWYDAWLVAFEQLKPGCQGYHWILFSKTHFNFHKNNHARVQAKMGAAGPASARLNAAWTTQSRSRGGDPKLA